MLDFFGPPSPQDPDQNSRSSGYEAGKTAESEEASMSTFQVSICQSFPRQPTLEHLIDSIEYR